jgi:hypothetical protein
VNVKKIDLCSLEKIFFKADAEFLVISTKDYRGSLKRKKNIMCCNESEYECYFGGMRARKDVQLLVTKMGQEEIKPKHLKWFLGLTEEELDKLSGKDHSGKGSYGGTTEIF